MESVSILLRRRGKSAGIVSGVGRGRDVGCIEMKGDFLG